MTLKLTHIKKSLLYRFVAIFIATTFIFTNTVVPVSAQTQMIITPAVMPPVGSLVGVSENYSPLIVKGIEIHPDNPLKFSFLVDLGDTELKDDKLEVEVKRLINYFMAGITVPEEEMWVNLSPYENNRIIPDSLGQTAMGRDLLAQDYMLKQISASLMYPEDELGDAFWTRIHDRIEELYGPGVEVPTNVFNKVWIVPDSARIYIHNTQIFLTHTHLKVMLEEDYVAAREAIGADVEHMETEGELLSQTEVAEVVRTVLLPEIEEEVNKGENFAVLRQIFNSVILASWYKENLKDSLIGKVYADKNKLKGIDENEKENNEAIYNQYLEAFKEGVYNYIKEEYDPVNQQIIPRKYFSGGMRVIGVNKIAQTEEIGEVQRTLPQRRIIDLVAAMGGQSVNMQSWEVDFNEIGPQAVPLVNSAKTPTGYNLNIKFKQSQPEIVPINQTPNASSLPQVQYRLPEAVTKPDIIIRPEIDVPFDTFDVNSSGVKVAAWRGSVEIFEPDGIRSQTITIPDSIGYNFQSAKLQPWGVKLLTLDTNNTVILTNLVNPSSKIAIQDNQNQSINDARFTPDGDYFVVSGNNSYGIYDAETGVEVNRIVEPDNNFRQVAFTADGLKMATLAERNILIRNMENPSDFNTLTTGVRILSVIAEGNDRFVSMDISPDTVSPIAAVERQSGDRNVIQFYNLNTREPVGEAFEGTNPRFSPTGDLTYTQRQNGTTQIVIQDITSGNQNFVLNTPDFQAPQIQVASNGVDMYVLEGDRFEMYQVANRQDLTPMQMMLDATRELQRLERLVGSNDVTFDPVKIQARIEELKTQIRNQRAMAFVDSAEVSPSTLPPEPITPASFAGVPQEVFEGYERQTAIGLENRMPPLLKKDIIRSIFENAGSKNTKVFKEIDRRVNFRITGSISDPFFVTEEGSSVVRDPVRMSALTPRELVRVAQAVDREENASALRNLYPSVPRQVLEGRTVQDLADPQFADQVVREVWKSAQRKNFLNFQQGDVFIEFVGSEDNPQLSLYTQESYPLKKTQSMADLRLTQLASLSRTINNSRYRYDIKWTKFQQAAQVIAVDVARQLDRRGEVTVSLGGEVGERFLSVNYTPSADELRTIPADRMSSIVEGWVERIAEEVIERIEEPQGPDVISMIQRTFVPENYRIVTTVSDPQGFTRNGLTSAFVQIDATVEKLDQIEFSASTLNEQDQHDAYMRSFKESPEYRMVRDFISERPSEITSRLGSTLNNDQMDRVANLLAYWVQQEVALRSLRLGLEAVPTVQRRNILKEMDSQGLDRVIGMIGNIVLKRPQMSQIDSQLRSQLPDRDREASNLRRTTQQRGQDAVGGIDLNPEMLDLQIKRDENGIPFPVLDQPIENMQIEGFLPVIINVTPVNSLPLLLGQTDDLIPPENSVFESAHMPNQEPLI